MLKKLKKNKLSLFLLAMVTMLSIYYIMMPVKQDELKPTVSDDLNTKTRYEQFAEMRLEIIDERKALVTTMEEKMSSNEVCLTDSITYTKAIEEIASITEQEVYLETIISNLGYEDSLVYLKEDNNLDIYILTSSFTVENYIDLAKRSKEIFGDSCSINVEVVLGN